MQTLPTALTAIDLVASAVFAITGATRRVAQANGYRRLCWLGLVTGIGGGAVRDLLLGLPVFWVREPAYVIVCLAASAAVYFGAHGLDSRYRALLWLDAIGLALVSVGGAAKGLDAGAGPVNAIVMGVITAALGGIITTLRHV